ncbi:MAG: type II toxin-antitoxin system VapC family toxin [Pseudomonadota bacterium]
MRLLLDCHALFWALADPPNLSATAREAILDEDNAVFYSPIGLYEMVFKASRGRAPAEALTLPLAAGRAEFDEVTLTTEHFLHAARMDWSHGDPWDRIVLAQAMLEDMRLVSADRAFDAVTDRRLW